MGKKSKRNRSSASSANYNKSRPSQQQSQQPTRRMDDDDDLEEEEDIRHRVPPSLRTPDEETKDNLRFQDPFVEEYNYRDDDDDDDDDEWEDDDDDEDEEFNDDSNKDDTNEPMKASAKEGKQQQQPANSKKKKSVARNDDDLPNDENSGMDEIVQTWNPFSAGQRQSSSNSHDQEELEMDPTAYKMYHMIQNEWPSLSFDIVYDNLGIVRNTFPHTILCVCGTQTAPDGNNSSSSSSSNSNQITVMKLSDLHRIHIDTDDDILGEEIDHDGNENEDDESDADDDLDDEDVEPVIEHYSMKHNGGVNRIRIMKQSQSSTTTNNVDIVASWSDTGNVYLYNIGPVKERFLTDTTKMTPLPNNLATAMPTQPFFSYKNEDVGVEGYALDWSPIITGRMATGDCHGSIHLWTPRENGSSFDISYLYNNVSNAKRLNPNKINSVEDIQWSPTEATVLASATANDGCVRIYDTRKAGQAMIQQSLSHRPTDINVLSWNPLVTNLLATGDDDGTLAVWDLRHFTTSSSSSNNKNKVQPLARFTPHTTPITSVEWHPTDESMLVASDDVGTYIYDLSVEEDDTTTSAKNNNMDIPPQLLFVHNGSEQFKEVHWHPQITSCVMTTALTGLSVFIPSNL